MFCKNCGYELSDDTIFCPKCGTNCQKTTVENIYSNTIEYAGFWKRFIAYIIDYIIIIIAVFIIAFFIGIIYGLTSGTTEDAEALGFLVGILIPWIYYAGLESSSKQATIGKQALGIIVTDLDGNSITFGKATIRYFAKIISVLVLLIGFIMIGFTEKKQGLHDIITNCLVIVKN